MITDTETLLRSTSMKTLYADIAILLIKNLTQAEVAMASIPHDVLSDGYHYMKRAEAVGLIQATRNSLIRLTAADVEVETLALPLAAE
jgi:hypothetical protein